MLQFVEKLMHRLATSRALAGSREMRKTWFETRRDHAPPVGLPAELPTLSAAERRSYPRLAAIADRSDVVEIARRDGIPVPATADREGYFGSSHFAYWLSGCADVEEMEKHVPAAAFARVLDLGGASGRVARHLLLRHPASRVDVAELNVNHVEFIERHFPPSAKAVKLSPYPMLPYGDRAFSLVCAFSVFTHLDAYESGWLAEIARVLEPGGYAYLTAHTEHTWEILPETFVFSTLRSLPEFKAVYEPGAPMPGDHLVFDYAQNSIEYGCQAFHHSDYLRRRWGKWLDVIDIVPKASDYQTAVILRKA